MGRDSAGDLILVGVPILISQLGKGEVFVGSWADNFFGDWAPLQIPMELFDSYQGNQSAMIATLLGLRPRPGATVNNGERITGVALTNDQMAIR